MPRPSSASAFVRRRPLSVALLVAVCGALVAVAVTGLAVAKSFTLGAAQHAKVTNAQGVIKHEGIAVNGHGRAVYDLVPETIHHALCTSANQCLSVWLPVTVVSARAKPTAAPGVKGKLGVWHRDGFFQVTLAGHPLYTFVADTKKDVATGDLIKHFGGTWHVILAGSTKKNAQNPTPTSSTTMTTPSYPGY
jgi:predicted lipoprotein with Yx(FWY)xxD motif